MHKSVLRLLLKINLPLKLIVAMQLSTKMYSSITTVSLKYLAIKINTHSFIPMKSSSNNIATTIFNSGMPATTTAIITVTTR